MSSATSFPGALAAQSGAQPLRSSSRLQMRHAGSHRLFPHQLPPRLHHRYHEEDALEEMALPLAQPDPFSEDFENGSTARREGGGDGEEAENDRDARRLFSPQGGGGRARGELRQMQIRSLTGSAQGEGGENHDEDLRGNGDGLSESGDAGATGRRRSFTVAMSSSPHPTAHGEENVVAVHSQDDNENPRPRSADENALTDLEMHVDLVRDDDADDDAGDNGVQHPWTTAHRGSGGEELGLPEATSAPRSSSTAADGSNLDVIDLTIDEREGDEAQGFMRRLEAHPRPARWVTGVMDAGARQGDATRQRSFAQRLRLNEAGAYVGVPRSPSDSDDLLFSATVGSSAQGGHPTRSSSWNRRGTQSSQHEHPSLALHTLQNLRGRRQLPGRNEAMPEAARATPEWLLMLDMLQAMNRHRGDATHPPRSANEFSSSTGTTMHHSGAPASSATTASAAAVSTQLNTARGALIGHSIAASNLQTVSSEALSERSSAPATRNDTVNVAPLPPVTNPPLPESSNASDVTAPSSSSSSSSAAAAAALTASESCQPPASGTGSAAEGENTESGGGGSSSNKAEGSGANHSDRKLLEELGEEFVCCICHDVIAGAHSLPCGHSFCGSCIVRWLERKKTCPNCRTSSGAGPVQVRTLDVAISKIITRILPAAQLEEHKQRLDAWNEEQTRKRRAPEPPSSSRASTGAPPFDALNAHVLALRQLQHQFRLQSRLHQYHVAIEHFRRRSSQNGDAGEGGAQGRAAGASIAGGVAAVAGEGGGGAVGGGGQASAGTPSLSTVPSLQMREDLRRRMLGRRPERVGRPGWSSDDFRSSDSDDDMRRRAAEPPSSSSASWMRNLPSDVPSFSDPLASAATGAPASSAATSRASGYPSTVSSGIASWLPRGSPFRVPASLAASSAASAAIPRPASTSALRSDLHDPIITEVDTPNNLAVRASRIRFTMRDPSSSGSFVDGAHAGGVSGGGAPGGGGGSATRPPLSSWFPSPHSASDEVPRLPTFLYPPPLNNVPRSTSRFSPFLSSSSPGSATALATSLRGNPNVSGTGANAAPTIVGFPRPAAVRSSAAAAANTEPPSLGRMQDEMRTEDVHRRSLDWDFRNPDDGPSASHPPPTSTITTSRLVSSTASDDFRSSMTATSARAAAIATMTATARSAEGAPAAAVAPFQRHSSSSPASPPYAPSSPIYHRMSSSLSSPPNVYFPDSPLHEEREPASIPPHRLQRSPPYVPRSPRPSPSSLPLASPPAIGDPLSPSPAASTAATDPREQREGQVRANAATATRRIRELLQECFDERSMAGTGRQDEGAGGGGGGGRRQ